MPIMSVRLDERSLKKIRKLAGRENKDQSAVARELIAGGWDYLMIRRYKEGRLLLIYWRTSAWRPPLSTTTI